MLRNSLAVALGGALGSLARFWLAEAFGALGMVHFPWATLLANVSGSFLIGLITALTGPRAAAGGTPAAPVLDGRHLRRLHHVLRVQPADADPGAGRRVGRAGLNVVLSLVLCLLAVWLGDGAAAWLQPARGRMTMELPQDGCCCGSSSASATGSRAGRSTTRSSRKRASCIWPAPRSCGARWVMGRELAHPPRQPPGDLRGSADRGRDRRQRGHHRGLPARAREDDWQRLGHFGASEGDPLRAGSQPDNSANAAAWPTPMALMTCRSDRDHIRDRCSVLAPRGRGRKMAPSSPIKARHGWRGAARLPHSGRRHYPPVGVFVPARHGGRDLMRRSWPVASSTETFAFPGRLAAHEAGRRLGRRRDADRAPGLAYPLGVPPAAGGGLLPTRRSRHGRLGRLAKATVSAIFLASGNPTDALYNIIRDIHPLFC